MTDEDARARKGFSEPNMADLSTDTDHLDADVDCLVVDCCFTHHLEPSDIWETMPRIDNPYLLYINDYDLFFSWKGEEMYVQDLDLSLKLTPSFSLELCQFIDGLGLSNSAVAFALKKGSNMPEVRRIVEGLMDIGHCDNFNHGTLREMKVIESPMGRILYLNYETVMQGDGDEG